MSLDQMTDDELDARVRRLLPAPPIGRDWEHDQRERLLHFIATGETTPREVVAAADPPVAIVRVHSHLDRVTRQRRWLFATAATVVAALALAAVTFGRLADGPAPAEQPVTAPASVVPVPATVPSLPAGSVRPDRFAIVADDWPGAATASAMWGGMVAWDNGSAAEALVARRDGDFLRGGVALTVRSGEPDSPIATPPQTATIAGVDFEVSVESGSPSITSVELPGTPTIAASGVDALAFVQAAGGMPVTGARVDEAGESTFAVGSLPDGYEVVVPPARLQLGAMEASTRAPDGDAGDGISIWVGVRNPLISSAQVGDLQRVDINGTTGWLRDSGPGANVMWQVSETTWALVGGATTADDALAFARSVEFVDEATWSQHYGVEQPDYPSRDEMLPESASSVPVASTPEPTSLVVARSERGAAPTDVPVACGSHAPLDEPIDSAPTASDPDAALAAFLETSRARTLYSLGYEQVAIANTGSYRYERRNEGGDLVTIIDVTASGNEWQATRLQTSPC